MGIPRGCGKTHGRHTHHRGSPSLIRDRGTAEGFPEPDELAAELEPFRALEDQQTVRLALAAAVRKNERIPARLAAQALALLGGDLEGARALVTGVDGDACLTVNILPPRPPTVANFLLHLGQRDPRRLRSPGQRSLWE